MNRVVKVFTTLKEHKKKSIFAASALSYLFYYLNNREKEKAIFREYCEKAKRFGDELLPSVSRPRKVTVLVNEFAKNGKCKYDFEKYALPLLHLAGLEVYVLKAQDAGQLKEIASVLDREEADAVYVVGGDGTVSTVLNGMMQMVNNIDRNAKGGKGVPPPVGTFPGGLENVSAKQILPQVDPNIKWYGENAMAIIKGAFETRSVVEVQIDDGEPFYAAQYLHFGPFQAVESIKWKYWYWEPKSVDYSKIINEKCGNVCEKDFKTVEILASNEKNEHFKNLKLFVGPDDLNRKGFAEEGLRREEQMKFGLYPSEKFGSTNFLAREMIISPVRPFVEDEEQPNFRVSIDGELHECLNKIKLKVIPDVMQTFVV